MSDLLPFVPGAAGVLLGVAIILLRKPVARLLYENEEWWSHHPRMNWVSWLFTYRGVLPNDVNARDARLGGLVVGIGIALPSAGLLVAAWLSR
ncbi:MAG: hypothetical protein ABR548_07055 [Actinomycetota bacterium]